MAELSHLDDEGKARMVDVSGKPDTDRLARVRAEVVVSARTMDLIAGGGVPKGDVLATARLAGIMAAKRTAGLIPLCHPLSLRHADVRLELDRERNRVLIEAEARTFGPTGVEMEALVGAQIAAATIYDMCKAVQKDIRIENVRLVYKSGGKSGTFIA
jgi:cyclic pyranopterin phosphate synthase